MSIHGCSRLWKQKELRQQCNRTTTTTTTTNITKSKTKQNKIVPFALECGISVSRLTWLTPYDHCASRWFVEVPFAADKQLYESFVDLSALSETCILTLCLLIATKISDDLRKRNKPVLRQQLSSFLSLNCHCEDSAPLQKKGKNV